jgi:hypothetical protein
MLPKCKESRHASIKKTTRANYRDASGAFHLEEELLKKFADLGRMNARDTNAMIPQMLQPSGIHSLRQPYPCTSFRPMLLPRARA